MQISRLGKVFGVLSAKQRQLAVVVESVLSGEECKALIRRSEDREYEPALVNVGGGQQTMRTDVRNSDRCIIDDGEVTKDIWNRLAHRLSKDVVGEDRHKELALDRLLIRRPSDGRTWRVRGMNERLRFLRYKDGHFFRPHFDGSYTHSPTLKSFTTAMIYLNDTRLGSGLTHFLTSKPRDEIERISVQPKAGMVLLFQHNLQHEGGAVLPGDTKYAIRTDIMYSRDDHDADDESRTVNRNKTP